MSNSKEAILFVPGMGGKQPEEYLEKLIAGVKNYCSFKGLSFQIHSEVIAEGSGERVVEIGFPGGGSKKITIKEIYWGDLRPSLSSEASMQKIIRGITLLVFWSSSVKIWKRAAQNKYMMFNMIVTLLIMLLWYYGTLAAVFTAIGANPEILELKLPSNVADFFETLGSRLGGWYVWGFTSVILGILPVTQIIDISFATKSYLQNYSGIFHKTGSRIGNLLANMHKNKNYDRITVVGHSFGTVTSTEVLADYSGTENIRFVTLGSPLLLIAARSRRVSEAIKKVSVNPKIISWCDFYSNQDWLCSSSPVSDTIEKFSSKEITTTVPFDEKINGASHNLYFDDWDVIEKILLESSSQKI